MQDPIEVSQIVDRIIQLCKEESGPLYLGLMVVFVIVSKLPLGDWARSLFPGQDSESRVSERPLKQYVFPNSENPTIIENLNLMMPPKQEEEDQNDKQ